MKTKKFIVQIEFDETTRWHIEPLKFAGKLEAVAQELAEARTSGSVPKVTVIVEN